MRLIAGRLPGAGAKLVRQTIETTTPARPGDVLTIVAEVMSKSPEGRHVTIAVRATNQHGDLAMSGTAEIIAPKKSIIAEPSVEFVAEMREKGRRYAQLIEATRSMKPLKTAVVHPVDEASLLGAVEAAHEALMEPVLIGPEAKIRQAAAAHNIDISGFEIVSTEHSHAAAAKAVAMVRSGEVEALMKGALHTDELMHEVVASQTGLRTSRRISHVFAIDAPAYPRALFITDAAVNIFPDPDRKARHRPERHRPGDRSRDHHAARRDPLGGRDRLARYPIDPRRGGSVQDGRSRPDHRRHPRWPPRVR